MKTVRVQVEELKNADKLCHLRQAALMEGLTSMDLEVIASICLDRIYRRGEVIVATLLLLVRQRFTKGSDYQFGYSVLCANLISVSPIGMCVQEA